MKTGPASGSGRRAGLAPALLLLLLYAGYMLAVGMASWREPFASDGVRMQGVRCIADNFDRLCYLGRGQWAVGVSFPERGYYTNYPFLMTLYFGLPFLLTRTPELLLGFFPVSNLLWLALLLAMAAPLAGQSRSWLWFWALPTTAYFIGNRFDIIPVTFTVGALALLHRRRWLASSMLLALALSSKWYPLVLYLPLFRYLQANGANRRVIAGYLLLPLLVAGGLQCLAWPFASDAPAQPVMLAGHELKRLFGTAAEADPASLIGLAAYFLPAALPWLTLISPLCWALALALPLLQRPGSYAGLLAQGAACLILLIAGSHMYSPQWFLWYAPLAALCLTTARNAWLLAAISAATYLRFPLLFDLAGPGSLYYAAGALLVWLLNALLLVRLLRHPPGRT